MIDKNFNNGDLVVLLDTLTLCRELKDNRVRYKPSWHDKVGVVLDCYLQNDTEFFYKVSLSDTTETITLSELYCWHPEQVLRLTYEEMCKWAEKKMETSEEKS